ncbi:hypothetical protein DZF91_29770 [Actinomadura logoneensis]|uniref:Uncharacterized protein n=2 Tax=Actinomadura logoneensis TaxID=2293572 RepID=A0A372JDG2_9ACTN|nr:hypothetical protein DZF91_29770 [Actinomadura logoneensis]
MSAPIVPATPSSPVPDPTATSAPAPVTPLTPAASDRQDGPAPVLALSPGEEITTDLHLDALAPGEHHRDTLVVRYRAEEDAVVALRVECADPAAASRDVRVGVFEHAGELMPFPVFSGTLLDLARRDRAFGRWTGRGDGDDHEVVYEISTSVARDAAFPSAPADVTLHFTATRD